jgi:extracellular elastinolytic metalloproteinase
MPHTTRRLAAAGLALAACAAAIPATAGAVASNAGSARSGPRPFFDSRASANVSSGDPARPLPAGDRAARAKLARGLGDQAALVADPITATPRAFGRLDGTLTGPQAGDPADIAMRYVRANLSALGLTTADLATLRLAERDSAGGVTHLRWRQEVDGIPAFDNELRVNVAADGRVINVLGAPRHALSVASTTPRLSAAEAMAAVAQNVGSSRRTAVTAGPTGARRATEFSSGDRARLVLFGDVNAVRLSWHLTFKAAPDAWYDAVVDAASGRVLRRVNLTKSAINADVFEHYPGAAPPQSRGLDQYLTGGDTATTLSGPFAHAWSDLNDASGSAVAETPSTGEEVNPHAPPAFFDFTPAVDGAGACDTAHLCSWDHRVARSWNRNRAQNAIQAFWYVNNYHDHLAADPIGFTPAEGNFATDDPVLVETDDGANGTGTGLPDDRHVDNANMSTPPDGQSPVMQMYLFENATGSPFRDVNGGDDASVVYHEYTHGLSSRLVTDADGVEAVNTAQAGAMGEAWSDFYAKDFLVDQGLRTDTAAPGQVDMGEYVDATPHQIRNQALDCPVGAPAAVCPGSPTAGAGGFTYGDFAKISGRGAEVHDDGEIWAETLWDLRDALGSTLTEELVTEAMRLSPPEPSFLDERNAILQADIALHQGADIDRIWAVFERRGMGFFAGTTDSTDIAPVASPLPRPPANGPTGTITGRAFDASSGAPLSGVVVGIGGLNTPPSNFTATTNANGAYAIPSVPAGSYPVLTFRPPTGYERFTTPVTVPSNGTGVTANAPMRRDWATTTAGAVVTATNDNVFAPIGCGTNGAFDLDPAAGWSAFHQSVPAPDNPHAGVPPTATVALPRAITVTAFGVNPTNTCSDDTSTATKDLRIEVSANGTAFTTVMTPRFDTASLGKVTTLAVAAAIPNVRFVRITMLTNQLPAAAPSTADGQSFTDLTEFEVFGPPTPAPPPPPPAGGGGAPPANPAPAPAPQPLPQPGGGTAPAQALSKPTGAIAASRTRGRATFTVGCSIACRATATMTVSRATARRLHLRSRRLARVTRSLTRSGRRTFSLTVGSTTLRRIRARGVRTVSTTVTVAIRDSRGQTRTVKRAVRVRVR